MQARTSRVVAIAIRPDSSRCVVPDICRGRIHTTTRCRSQCCYLMDIRHSNDILSIMVAEKDWLKTASLILGHKYLDKNIKFRPQATECAFTSNIMILCRVDSVDYIKNREAKKSASKELNADFFLIPYFAFTINFSTSAPFVSYISRCRFCPSVHPEMT